MQRSGIRERGNNPDFVSLHPGYARYAKRARGLMASYIVKNRLSEVDTLKDFAVDASGFNRKLSKGDVLVFTRKMPEKA